MSSNDLCKLCKREAVSGSDLCRYHTLAYKNLVSSYEKWREALEELSWIEYLERIKDLEGTGIWIKEVAELKLADKRRSV